MLTPEENDLSNDDLRLQGQVLALSLAVRELMQRLHETDPMQAAALRNRIAGQIIREPGMDEVKAAASAFCQRLLFVTD
jgi:hypothetical protein